MSVNASKGKVGGGISFAAAGSTLPTDTTTELADVFKGLGYISEDGVSRSVALDSTSVKDWHGAVVAQLYNGKTETLKFKVIDCTNVDTLGLVFGSATGAAASGITVKSTADAQAEHAYVIEAVLSDGTAQRLCVPRGVISGIGEIKYAGKEVVGFELTITALEDTAGVTVYEYMKAAA